MNINLSRIDRGLQTLLKTISRQAGLNKMRVYLVGGIVRDLILDRQNLDVDIVVEGDAFSLAKTLPSRWKKDLVAYREFMTVTMRLPDGWRVDLATARQETYAHSGALPQVAAGSIQQDLFRRDFTINALAVSINKDSWGQVVDLYDGLSDLRKGIVRILHALSFVDDPTRILRAVRFEQRFGFALERKTGQLLTQALKNRVVDNVKPARYFAEFRKILSEERPSNSLRRLYQWAGLDFIEPGYHPDWRSLKTVEHTLVRSQGQAGGSAAERSLVFFLAVMGRLSEEKWERASLRFHFTRQEKECLQVLPKVVGIIKRISRSRLAASAIYRILSPLPEGIIYFIRARCSARIVNSRVDRYLQHSRFSRPSVTGEDIKRLGVGEGRQIGRILETLLMHKIDGFLPTKADEVRQAKQLIEHKGLTP